MSPSPPTPVGYLELFHLAFLTELRPRPDRFQFILKGGGNLRYFYGSVRYSQDIDLDVHGSVDTIQAAVENALNAGSLATTLAASGVTITSCHATKQTEVTQRWSIQLEIRLSVDGGADVAPTKIELSARPEMPDYAGETADAFVPTRIVGRHGIRAPLLTHYLPAPAIVQKICTLGERQRVQSRDVFDLELLFRTHRDVDARGRLTDAQLKLAIDRALEVPYEAYRQQVIAYLDDAFVAQYDDPRQWEHIQLSVVEHLEALR